MDGGTLGVSGMAGIIPARLFGEACYWVNGNCICVKIHRKAAKGQRFRKERLALARKLLFFAFPLFH